MAERAPKGHRAPVAARSGAPSRPTENWDQPDWDRIPVQVNRLQVSIAKACAKACAASPSGSVSRGLSRMRGNSHVRFLREGAAVMPSPYLTH